MINGIDGNLALIEKNDEYKPYIYYTVHCTDSLDSKIKLHSVFQIRFDKHYELTAKVNDFTESKLLVIDAQMKKKYLQMWLAEVEMKGGFYLQKNYLYSGLVGLPKTEEKFVSVNSDFFFGVKTAVDCIRDDLLYA